MGFVCLFVCIIFLDTCVSKVKLWLERLSRGPKQLVSVHRISWLRGFRCVGRGPFGIFVVEVQVLCSSGNQWFVCSFTHSPFIDLMAVEPLGYAVSYPHAVWADREGNLRLELEKRSGGGSPKINF